MRADATPANYLYGWPRSPNTHQRSRSPLSNLWLQINSFPFHSSTTLRPRNICTPTPIVIISWVIAVTIMNININWWGSGPSAGYTKAAAAPVTSFRELCVTTREWSPIKILTLPLELVGAKGFDGEANHQKNGSAFCKKRNRRDFQQNKSQTKKTAKWSDNSIKRGNNVATAFTSTQHRTRNYTNIS